MSFTPQTDEDDIFNPRKYIVENLDKILPDHDNSAKVEWWLGVMFKPTNKYQLPKEWAPHALSSLVAFIKMDKDQQKDIVQRRKNTDMPYRGEEYDQYVTLSNEYLNYLKSPEAYKKEVLNKLKRIKL